MTVIDKGRIRAGTIALDKRSESSPMPAARFTPVLLDVETEGREAELPYDRR
jgi:hypothetical protein